MSNIYKYSTYNRKLRVSTIWTIKFLYLNPAKKFSYYHTIIFQVIYPKRYQEAKEKTLEKIDEKVEESNYESEFESETSDNSSTKEEYDDTVVPTEISAQSN